MRTVIFAFLAIALAFFMPLNAFAELSGFPETVEFREIPKEVSFIVKNGESVPRTLEINVSLPVEYQFLQKPVSVGPNQPAEIKLRLFPRPGLVGSTYTGSVKISMGISAFEKNIRLVFLPQDSCAVQITPKAAALDATGQKIIVSSGLFNPKQFEESISFEKINGIPGTWVVEIGSLEKIGPKQNILHTLALNPNTAFEGKAELVYNCGGFLSKKTVDISYKPENVLFTGFASLFSFDFFSNELLLDAMLVLIAAFLLIAFISRMVRKVSFQKEMIVLEGKKLQEKQVETKFGKPGKKLAELKKQVQKK